LLYLNLAYDLESYCICIENSIFKVNEITYFMDFCLSIAYS